MLASTESALRRINRDFYSRHAADFDRTRRPGGWQGWQRVLESVARAEDRPLRVLDLGCGNGRFALFLEENPELRGNRPFEYLGIDLSPELIGYAREAAAGRRHVRFEIDDIEKRPLGAAARDLVVLFGVVHHLPSFGVRRRVLERAASAVAPGGVLALTCWQFADDPRLDSWSLDWSQEPAVDPEELEPGDHLLRWGVADAGGRRQSRRRSSRRLRRQRVRTRLARPRASRVTVRAPVFGRSDVRPAHQARRYCHFTDEAELDRLIDGLPFTEVARYRSDGPGGRQNLYWLGARDRAASLS